jgi:hypothetical protein
VNPHELQIESETKWKGKQDPRDVLDAFQVFNGWSISSLQQSMEEFFCGELTPKSDEYAILGLRLWSGRPPTGRIP